MGTLSHGGCTEKSGPCVMPSGKAAAVSVPLCLLSTLAGVVRGQGGGVETERGLESGEQSTCHEARPRKGKKWET